MLNKHHVFLLLLKLQDAEMKVTEVSLEINSQHVAEDLRSCWTLNQLLHNDAAMSMLLQYVLNHNILQLQNRIAFILYILLSLFICLFFIKLTTLNRN